MKGHCLTGAEFQFGVMDKFWRWTGWEFYNNVKALDAPKLFT